MGDSFPMINCLFRLTAVVLAKVVLYKFALLLQEGVGGVRY